MFALNFIVVPLVARICLVVMFPFSAVDKIVHWDNAMMQADSSILPNVFGPPMLAAAIVIELATPVLIVIGWHDRLAALVLAIFCVVTAILFHPFWQYPDFWSPNDKTANSHFWDFLKNFGLVGGLLLVLIGGAPVPVSHVIGHPLTSAPTIASPHLPSSR